jgi:hypothetical protein
MFPMDSNCAVTDWLSAIALSMSPERLHPTMAVFSLRAVQSLVANCSGEADGEVFSVSPAWSSFSLEWMPLISPVLLGGQKRGCEKKHRWRPEASPGAGHDKKTPTRETVLRFNRFPECISKDYMPRSAVEPVCIFEKFTQPSLCDCLLRVSHIKSLLI